MHNEIPNVNREIEREEQYGKWDREKNRAWFTDFASFSDVVCGLKNGEFFQNITRCYRTSVTKKILEVFSNSVYSYGIIIQILKVLYNFQVETRLTSPFFPCIVWGIPMIELSTNKC